jgi:hypothetical protein
MQIRADQCALAGAELVARRTREPEQLAASEVRRRELGLKQILRGRLDGARIERRGADRRRGGVDRGRLGRAAAAIAGRE